MVAFKIIRTYKRIRLSILILLIFGAMLAGCESVSYYGQAISGQFGIILRQKPITKLLSDPQTPPDLQAQLRHVLEIRTFAREKLHLPVNKHYQSYAKLDRPYVVWALFAAPEFSLTPKTWCYPIIGCTSYRGYFSESRAQRYSRQLASEGFDVFLSGVGAYSTLGWFEDPLLSTVIDRSPTALAALIFHELAHQVLYVPDDTAFNESFATAVEQAGLKHWLTARSDMPAFQAYLRDQRRQRQFTQLIMQYRQTLAGLYGRSLSAVIKRQRKAAILDALRMDFQKLKRTWENHGSYDAWFNRPLNNAQLNSVAAYHEFVPAFLKLLKQQNNDLALFYEQCRQLAAKPKAERRRLLLY